MDVRFWKWFAVILDRRAASPIIMDEEALDTQDRHRIRQDRDSVAKNHCDPHLTCPQWRVAIALPKTNTPASDNAPGGYLRLQKQTLINLHRHTLLERQYGKSQN